MKRIFLTTISVLFLSMNLFALRFYDSDLMRFMSIDPEEEFASPYLFCGNNPIKFIDPDGCRTVVAIDSNNVVTDMQYTQDDEDTYVYINGEKVGSEPPQGSYFYETTKVNEKEVYNIVLEKATYFGDFNDDLLSDIKSAWHYPIWDKKNANRWGTDGELDFKYDYPNMIGFAFGSVMTSRDAGNANWGAYMGDRYDFLGRNMMIKISNKYAQKNGRKKEDYRSMVMQKWGFDKKLYYFSNRNY